MVETVDQALELDPDQRLVAQSASSERLVVIAGAGQGKTEVVTSRLKFLIEDEGLSASTELLVLSFSRAAVHAVRTRLTDREVAEVNVRTFDSYASQLLLEADVEPALGFEARIRQATSLLREGNDDVVQLVEDLQHVIVDEVQDLVGDRAEFVLAILERLSKEAGYTVLGDPLQGIYDFVLDDSSSRMTSSEVLECLLSDHSATRTTLSRNYRARGDDCRRVVDVGRRLRETVDPVVALDQLREVRDKLPHIDRCDDWGFLDLYPGRSAILCRSNAEVLRISRQLADLGIRHAVRRPAQAFGAARWIGPILAGLAGPNVERPVVEGLLAGKFGEQEAEDAWYLLKGAEGGRGRSRDQLNLDRIRRRVASSTVPLTLTQGDDEVDVVISTIHRAKGLEFDNVFLAAWRDPAEDDPDPWAQVRLEYVALTRARDAIVLVSTPRARPIVAEQRWLPGRLQERVGAQGKSRVRALEIGYDDTYTARPAEASEDSAASVQAALESLTTGVSVAGVLNLTRSDIQCPIYDLTVDGVSIGRTTEAFGEDFSKAFKVRQGEWPAELVDMVLVSVETTGGDPNIAEHAGVGPGGFWLVPRVAGLARPLWDVMEKVR
ncbi:UvrD-helicase domain-containing protein [Gordonia metallireducens]|uniref:UvrD-helicase domain-containing protein n=1 Tax=Gordonia metallireducens TaxID=2897779 RepID=UPI001E3ECF02|nr:UvrD-helicase domain-containing protein [Gordonia metallireducens]